ncbi:MAG: hypothetical protein GC156_15925 [Actinomycetales bacterium]|nr:hypothetical protein [Actinomycetales bacterium]
MKRPGRRVAVLLATASLVLTACTGGSEAPPSPSTAPTPVATSYAPSAALTQYAGLLNPRGQLSLTDAERIFAGYVVPLPGVDALTLTSPVPADLATTAVRRLLGSFDSLPPAERKAVRSALQSAAPEAVIPPSGASTTSPALFRSAGLIAPADLPTLSDLQAEVATIRDDLEQLSGHRMRLPIRIAIVPDRITGGDALTFAGGDPARPSSCRIQYPEGLFIGAYGRNPDGTVDESSIVSTIAHEVWHCFQLDARTDAFDTAPDWLIEGQAEWVGEEYAGGTSSAAPSWNTWLIAVDTSLYRRSYDAIGLYALAAARGANPWQAMLTMVGQGGTRAVETLFSAPAAQDVVADAESLVRNSSISGEWESLGPGITGARGATEFSIPAGGTADRTLPVAPFATFPLDLAVPDSDVLTISLHGGPGAVGFVDGPSVTLDDGGSVTYCIRDGGCTCPDGANPGGGDPLPQLDSTVGAAAIGSLRSARLTVTAGTVTLDDACRALVGTWHADLGDLIASAAVAATLPRSVSCSGPVTLTFNADGTFAERGAGSCTVRGRTFDEGWQATGTYTDDGQAVTITGARCSGTLLICLQDGTLPYTIVGPTLRLQQEASGGTVTKTYTRG